MGRLERLGIAPFVTLVEAPGVASATREHLRIEAPPGVILENAFLWSLDEQFEAGMKALPPTTSERVYQRRLTLGRASLYTAGVTQGTYAVVLGLRANPSGFLRRAQYVILLALLLLVSGTAAELLFDTLADIGDNQTDPTVALMLLVPTLLVAYVAREGDHQILGDLLRVPRFLVASTGLATLFSAIALVAGVSGWWLTGTWLVAAIWCAIVLLWLRAVNYLSRRSISAVSGEQGETFVEPITVLE